MSTATTAAYNPNHDLNAVLLDAGCSKTVYALVVPPTEKVKQDVLFDPAYFEMFREAWTSKQDALHNDFFNRWVSWSAPVIDFDRTNFPFVYPTAGASEPIRHLIYDLAARALAKIMKANNPGEARKNAPSVHFFEGEYEGYLSLAKAAGLNVEQHAREDWADVTNRIFGDDLFFISQPSAIDGNVWVDYNAFVASMPDNSIIADITYVGAIPERAVVERFDMNAPSIRNVVFSLSKPFGVYYDRIGGVFCREEDDGLFGNKWFKNLTSIAIGNALMERHDVFDYPQRYAMAQQVMSARASAALGIEFEPCDVLILAGARGGTNDEGLARYINRAGRYRLCLTPGIAASLGMTRPLEEIE